MRRIIRTKTKELLVSTIYKRELSLYLLVILSEEDYKYRIYFQRFCG
jgi:hypothetical protein